MPKLYDLAFGPEPCEAFYREEAHRAAGPVLELACGTGRLTIPIARDGYEIIGLDASQQEQQVGHAVANALAKRLVGDIQDMGLYAERAAEPVPPAGVDVLILGQLVSIDEGDAAERMIIGLGAGRSDVEAHVQVYQSTSGRQIPIETMSGTAKSTLMPGAAETMGSAP